MKIGKIYLFILFSILILCFSLTKIYDRFRNISPPPCMQLAPAGRHHEFKSNCIGQFTGINGEIIEYKINEMGMRERSLSLWKKNRIVLLGDSHIEGWGLPFSEVLSQKLERDDPAHSYLNMGIRSTGPLWQSLWFQNHARAIHAKKIVWVLNENDADDDHLAWALSEIAPQVDQYPALKFSIEDFSALSWHLPFLKFLPGQPSVWESMIKFPLYLKGVEKIKSRIPAEKIEWCTPIEAIRLKYPETKIYFSIFSLGPYNKSKSAPEKIQRLLSCINKNPVLDLRDELKSRVDLYQSNDVHLNRAGNEFVADKLRVFLRQDW